MTPSRWAIAFVLAALVLPGAPRADDARPSEYEDQRLQKVLGEEHLTIDPAPDGKRIRRILIVRKDVLADDEPFPTFLNAFHWRTRESTVARELLFHVGEPWDQARVDESERNLRGLVIFSIARVVPVQADEEGAVDALVFTRDLWSLRVETSFQVTDGFLNQLFVQLIERNFFGANTQAALRFELLPKTWSLGEVFSDPRVLGGDLAFTESFDLIFARDGSGLEGTRGTAELGSPLRNLRQTWGWRLAVGYEDSVGRRILGADVLDYDVPETAETEAIPEVWDHLAVAAAVEGIYQEGHDVIHRLKFGFAASDVTDDPRPGVPLSDDEERAFRRDVLPELRRDWYPYLTWTGFVPEYTTLRDLAGYGISEDVRLGPWWSLSVKAPLEAFGSADDALVVSASVGAIATPGGGLIDGVVGATGRLQQGEVDDQVVEVRLRGATPRLPFGRLVLFADWEGRRRDTTRTLVTLGGDNGLRGYATDALYGVGASRLRLNAELRSPPVVVASAHIGAVLFWDGGAVYEDVDAFDFRQSVGLGLRLLFPQFNRFTFRLDAGVPLESGGFTVLLTFGTLQAVPLTALEDDKLSSE
ncbi:MAG: BamA/TamA family outer membrane protein [Myxococcales bacterium]|nr:BamA/TamA family outer membrane protein [Myxococcales bacterium]MCB9732667.1 BamA/TamA family outer membrane protein [Deltaproteobacteria bacterium]